MKLKVIFCVFILLILSSVFICTKEKNKTETDIKTKETITNKISYSDIKKMFKDLKVNIETDKDIYHSGEDIITKIIVNSSFDLPDAYLRVYGIYANRYRIEEYRQVNIKTGENIFEFSFATPKCYGCSGISPGMYNVKVDVAPIILTGETNIEVKQ